MSKSNGTEKPTRLTSNQVQDLVYNALMSRVDLIKSMSDVKRDINKECNYPDTLEPEDYKKMYDREGIATRVVKLWPEESWAIEPELYEVEDQGTETEFEKAWEVLMKNFQLWSTLHRADEMSGIGRYGLILIGIDDGKPLHEPVDGVKDDGTFSETTAQRKLLFLRCFDESCVDITEYEKSPNSKRFGQPLMYNVKLSDVTTTGGVLGEKHTDAKVHWTRVIHLADNRLTSEVLGTPRMQTVYNRLYDIRKILGADGEGFWKGGFPGLSIEMIPGLENPDFDIEKLRDMASDYMEGMKRYLLLLGLSAKSIAPNVTAPDPHFDTQMRAIAISIGCPLDVLLGTTPAKLSQGSGDGPQQRTWNKRVRKRQTTYITPHVIIPFCTRLIHVGVLPRPAKMDAYGSFEYYVDWPDLNAPTDNDIATTATLITKALTDYVSGNVSSVIAPLEFLTLVLGFEIEEAEAILQEVGDRIHELEPSEEPTQVDAETGEPVPVDQFGTPIPRPPSPKE